MRKLLAVAVMYVCVAAFGWPLNAQAVVLVVSVESTPNPPANLSADQAAAWEAGRVDAGDVVSVKNDGWKLDVRHLGKIDPPANGGTLVFVDVPWLTQKEARSLLVNVFFTNKSGDQDLKRFRRYRIDWEKLPESAKSEAFYTGMVTLGDWRQVVILDKEAK